MLTLKSKKDGFRLILPKEFLMPEIEEKYRKILNTKRGFFVEPIDFLNETIQQVQVFGINNATVQQQQTTSMTKPIRTLTRDPQENLDSYDRQKAAETQGGSFEYTYRNVVSAAALIDNTINIYFRHTLGFLNYFMLFENFWYQYTRETKYKDLRFQFNIDILNEKGSIYSRVVLDYPLINAMDMLDFDYKQPIAEAEQFKVEFKYSNFDFEFLSLDD